MCPEIILYLGRIHFRRLFSLTLLFFLQLGGGPFMVRRCLSPNGKLTTIFTLPLTDCYF
jgi:hypothetical protein